MKIIIKGKEEFDFIEGQVYEEYQVYEFVRSIHYRKEDFDDGDIGKHIEEYEQYEAKIVKVEDLEDPHYYIDDENIEEYSEMSEETSPPVVLGYYSDGTYLTIDGGHRIIVAKTKGYKTIKAFVGVSKKD